MAGAGPERWGVERSRVEHWGVERSGVTSLAVVRGWGGRTAAASRARVVLLTDRWGANVWAARARARIEREPRFRVVALRIDRSRRRASRRSPGRTAVAEGRSRKAAAPEPGGEVWCGRSASSSGANRGETGGVLRCVVRRSTDSEAHFGFTPVRPHRHSSRVVENGAATPRWSLCALCGLYGTSLLWCAVTLPWRSTTLFAVLTGGLGLLNLGVALLALLRQRWLA